MRGTLAEVWFWTCIFTLVSIRFFNMITNETPGKLHGVPYLCGIWIEWCNLC
jgi:hypothetical protein